METACDVLCLQGTKKDFMDLSFIRNFCPPSFDAFHYLPSVGASGGIITLWKSSLLNGQLPFQNEFSVSVTFTSKFSDDDWLLTNIYGPSTHDGKREFVQWLKHIQTPHRVDWLLLGDLNLMRGPENRNKPGGDVSEMLWFYEAISALRLIEIPLRGRKYTWSNKQDPPLLERCWHSLESLVR